MTTENELNKIVVTEEADGSAVIDLPDSIESPDEQEDDRELASGGAIDDDVAPEDETEYQRARREKRRAKRDLAKKTGVEKDMKLQLLERKNQELMERLSVVERKTHSGDIARVEKAIQDEQARMQYALTKIKQATEAGDGDAMIKAQDLLYESRKRVEGFTNLKQRLTDSGAQQQSPIDGRIRNNANSWIERNPWFDPNGKDEDSAIAKVVDERLIAEGYNPASPDYWDELDSRLQKRLPHHYNRSRRDSSERRPKSFVTSSERETGGASSRNTFTLTPEQVRAMKDAGFWDDPEKRNKMIKRYATEARNSRS